tara:strand:+ start:147 stop:593 length:447 start_codon:yes stop_codon:yes gene_type:complete
MEINGVAHIHLMVRNFAKSAIFYSGLCEFFGLKEIYRTEKYLYYVGGRTGVAIGQASAEFREQRFEQQRVGLHHVCFRARSRIEVDEVYAYLVANHVKVVHRPESGLWVPGYYSVLFEDPDGIRLEVNHVPDKGILAEGAEFTPQGYA